MRATLPVVDSVRDPERVAAVRATQLLDTAPEEPFDGLAAHAASLLDAPLAFVSLVDDRRTRLARTRAATRES